MKHHPLVVGAFFAVVIFVGASDARAQRRTSATPSTPEAIQQRYGVQGTYDGTTLHPAGHRSASS